MPFLSAFIFISLALITFTADIFLKKAADKNLFFSWQLMSSIALYGLSAIGWFFLLKRMKLTTLGAIFGVSNIIFIALIGVFYFKEKISPVEIFGMILAIISLIILSRFA